MDEKLQSIIKNLRTMSSAEAATWLISEYPTSSDKSGYAIRAIAHNSWKKSDQIRLARHYLSKKPFAHSWPYEAFAQVMSTQNFVAILDENIPSDPKHLDLFKYNIIPVLKTLDASKSKVVSAFIAKIEGPTESIKNKKWWKFWV